LTDISMLGFCLRRVMTSFNQPRAQPKTLLSARQRENADMVQDE